MNPVLKAYKNGKKVLRCRKTRAGDWNYLTLDDYGFLYVCVLGKHPWGAVNPTKLFYEVKACYRNCTNLECLK